ncbi:MAG: hypothetical protein UV63_C0057G0008 [Microgenomates group bacterium GW2011_GWC1_43_11]|nr:MAG: hypothetical protein UV63_C0057G0008 [Microgenomates group bacterium GW2011_GWC1_43_11]
MAGPGRHPTVHNGSGYRRHDYSGLPSPSDDQTDEDKKPKEKPLDSARGESDVNEDVNPDDIPF